MSRRPCAVCGGLNQERRTPPPSHVKGRLIHWRWSEEDGDWVPGDERR